MRAGEPNVLTAERPLMFATTSGTTGRAKYIPVTPSYLREYSHGVARPHLPDASPTSATCWRASSSSPPAATSRGTPTAASPTAPSPATSRARQPEAIKRFYALPYELCAGEGRSSQKYYLTLRHAAAGRRALLVTPNPSSLLLLADKLTACADELIHDIRHGTVNPAYLPAGAPAALTAGLAPDPRRADELHGDPAPRRSR